MHSPKVALVYDRVNTQYGGAEKVLKALHELYPNAPLFTSVYDRERAAWAKDMRVVPSWLQKIPFSHKFHRALVALMPLAFESHTLDEFDIIISITSAEAKGVLTRPHQLHLCYLLTPTRYLWSHQEEYQSHWLTGWLRKDVFAYLKWWDRSAALRPDVIIPISRLVQKRCEQYYQRETEEVIYPPVELPRTASKTREHAQKEFFLIVARLVPYKRIDLAIETCQKLGKDLIIIGNGPDKNRLQNLIQDKPSSAANISLISSVLSEKLTEYFQQATAFLLPAEEDFGITALEAQSYGKPVVIYQKSGAAELIEHKKTGVHFPEQTVKSLSAALNEVQNIEWNQDLIRRNAERYSTQQFQKTFAKKVEDVWQQFQKQVQ